LPDHCLWLDLRDPTAAEISMVQHALGLELPSAAEAREIEFTSRFYLEDGAVFLTVPLPPLDGPAAAAVPLQVVTCILAGRRLLTLQHQASIESATQVPRWLKQTPAEALAVLWALIERAVDQYADSLEGVMARVDEVAKLTFASAPARHPSSERRTWALADRLRTLGQLADQNSHLADGLTQLRRMFIFLGAHVRESPGFSRSLSKGMARDVESLLTYSQFVEGKINFSLNALLGMINIEQNQIIKFFTVVAVVFLPPTLIASIYGMNFAHMPELAWPVGYPLALLVMLASAFGPLAWFRRKGWL